MNSTVDLVLLLFLALCGGGQQEPDALPLAPSGPAIQGERQLRATIGQEADTLLPDVLAHVLAMRGAQDVNVIAEQLPAAWLPLVSNVRFTRIPLQSAKPRWANCLRLLWAEASIANDSLTVSVTTGNRCFTSSTSDVFDRTAQGWKRSGLGSWTGSGSTHCECKVE
jgi:hypothetical protein